MKEWTSEPYEHQARNIWPGRGCHILAQYDEESVVVYQAFNEKIASYVCQHKTFDGCQHYNPKRMTWIKTNFLWMMFRSNWATRPNQERIVAIWLRRESFEKYLEWSQIKGSTRGIQGTVRLQWDPDHFPNSDRHPYRRAVQLGMRDIESFRNGDDFIDVQDITDFVASQRNIAKGKCWEGLMVASERVYNPISSFARERVGISEIAESDVEAQGRYYN